MKIRSRLICCVLPVVLLSACNKSDRAQETAAKPAPGTNSAPASPAPAAVLRPPRPAARMQPHPRRRAPRWLPPIGR